MTLFTVLPLLWTLLIASSNADKIKGRLPDIGIISSFLEQFIRPYIDSIQVNSGSPRAKEETAVDKAIRLKMADLKPMLQDDAQQNDNDKNVETDDKLALEGNDETTIIEFVPKTNLNVKKNKTKESLREGKPETDPFKKNINKYKQLRRNIIKLLDKEKTASRTKKLITNTLDEMIAQLIESQCTWKHVDPPDLHTHVFRTHKDTHKSLNKLHKLSEKEWKNLRKQYLNFLKFKEGEEDSFMRQFHDFFTNVINDTWNLSQRYKVRCQLVKVGEDTSSKQYLRQDKMVEKDQCDSFKVCTEELKDFLANFYTYLNDTSVSVFRNYAAMYVRDVNVDFGLDINVVVSVIDNISNTAERKVNKIFRKQLDKFTLDENKKKGANIQHINDFINTTVEQVKKGLKKNLDAELGAMKTKLFATVKDDLNVNLRVDLNNLGKLFIDRICSFFILCNGKYAARRLEKPWMFRPKETDKIYVKVQLTLDDELKESIARSGRFPKTWQGKDMTHRFVKHFKNDDLKYINVSVTRTTMTTTTEYTTVNKNTTAVPEKITPVFREMTEMVDNNLF